MTNFPTIPALVVSAGFVCLLASGATVRRRLLSAFQAGFIAGAAALIAVGPWLLKSWYFFGQPLYPNSSVASNPGGTTAGVPSPAPMEDHLRWIVTTLADI